jgi:hypothetical protein
MNLSLRTRAYASSLPSALASQAAAQAVSQPAAPTGIPSVISHGGQLWQVVPAGTPGSVLMSWGPGQQLFGGNTPPILSVVPA